MITVKDFDFKNKKALIRVDFNVPLNDKFEVTDTTRIEAAKPTLKKILDDGGSAVLMSHLGRPKGVEAKYSLKHIVNKVQSILGVEVKFVEDCIGDKALKQSSKLQNGEVLLLENLRFYAEEKEGDVNFAKQLSKHGQVYVNDAFGTAHRKHASTAIIAQFFEDKLMGCLLAKEIKNLDRVLNSTKKPVTAILGGAKVSSKITVIENMLDKIDNLIIGGGMTFTFVKAQGGQVGNSLIEADYEKMALNILRKAKQKKVNIYLPIDAVVADSFDNNAQQHIEKIDTIPEPWMGLDIGSDSVSEFEKVILDSKIILWNGPMGVFEFNNFSNGTKQVGQAVAKATSKGAFSLVGGGDSVAAAKKFGLSNQVSYISTGGGAMLEMLEGKILPGIKALE